MSEPRAADLAGSANSGTMSLETGGPLGPLETGTGKVFVTPLPVRWSDQDQFLHVNHARMISLIEEARIPWLFAAGTPTESLAAGAVISDLSVRYRGQVKHADGPVRVRMWCEKVGGALFRARHEVRCRTTQDSAAPEISCDATIAAFDLETQRPRRLGRDEREYLREFLPHNGR